MRRKLPIHVSKRVSRRGIRISPRAHWVRLIVYMILIPILTWYGHQKYTNPFMNHPNIQFREVNGAQILSFFETNYRDTMNQFDLYLDDIEVIDREVVNLRLSENGFFDLNDSLLQETIHHPNLTGVVNHASIILNYYHWNIVIPLNDKQLLLKKECDILVVDKSNADKLFQLREKYAPRLTIFRSRDTTFSLLPSNVHAHKVGEVLNIKEGRYRKLTVEKISF